MDASEQESVRPTVPAVDAAAIAASAPNSAIGLPVPNQLVSPHFARIVSNFVANARQLASTRPVTASATMESPAAAINSVATGLSMNFNLASSRLRSDQGSHSKKIKKKSTPGRPTATIRFKLTCLESSAVQTVHRLNTARLKKLGFGHSKAEMTKSGRVAKSYPLCFTADQFEENVRGQFPALGRTAIDFFVAKTGKKLIPIVGRTPADIKNELGTKSSANGSTIYIKPVLKLTSVSDAILYYGAKDPDSKPDSIESNDVTLTDRTELEGRVAQEMDVGGSNNPVAPVCSDCGRTKTTNTCLVCCQNMEYAMSLANDQRKDREREEGEALAVAEDKVRQERRDRHSRRIVDLSGSFPIKIKLPGGKEAFCRCLPNENLSVLVDFIGALADSSIEFTMVVPGQLLALRSTIAEDLPQHSLSDLGITGPVIIHVSWNRKSKDGSRTSQSEETSSDLTREPGVMSDESAGPSSQSEEPSSDLNREPDGSRTSQSEETSSDLTREPGVMSDSTFQDPDLPVIPHRRLVNVASMEQEGSGINASSSAMDVDVSGEPDVFHALANRVTAPEDMKSAEDLLLHFQETAREKNPDLKQCAIIDREDVFDSAVSATEEEGFSFSYMPVIEFAGEMGVDLGGPRREFFSLLMKEILLKQDLFEGDVERRAFSLNIEKLEEKAYFRAGQFNAWSLLHGSAGLGLLSKKVWSLMCKKVLEDPEDFQDVPDPDAFVLLQKMKDCKEDEEFRKVCQENVVFLIGIGCPEAADVVGLSQRRGLIKNVITYFLYYRVKPAVDQFTEGLQSIGGLYDVMLKNVEAFSLVMCGQKEDLTRTKLRALLAISYSKDKSRKTDEGTSVWLFELFLRKCEEESDEAITLSEMLQFMTGASSIPPLGLPKVIVQFYDVVPGEKRYPAANTCAPIMWLPRWRKVKGTDFKSPFYALLKEGVLASYGFDKM